jgi:hypothetical protein
MAHWFIVHKGTDTVLNLSECVLVDIDGLDIDGDDYSDDIAVLQLANSAGVPFSVFAGGVI